MAQLVAHLFRTVDQLRSTLLDAQDAEVVRLLGRHLSLELPVPARSSLGQPDHVWVVWGGDVQLEGIIVLRRRFGSLIRPLPNLRMPIGKRNASSSVMVAGWEINNSRRS